MPDLPDPAVVSRSAEIARTHAEELRVRAARLASQAEASEWAGPAARAFRAQTRELLARLQSAARHLDDAADRLHRHAADLRTEQAAAAQRHADEVRRIRAALSAIGLHP